MESGSPKLSWGKNTISGKAELSSMELRGGKYVARLSNETDSNAKTVAVDGMKSDVIQTFIT